MKAKMVQAYEVHSITINFLEPRSEQWFPVPVCDLATEDMAKKLLKRISPNEELGDLGTSYSHLTITSGLSKNKPHETLKAAEAALRTVLDEEYNAEDECIGELLKK